MWLRLLMSSTPTKKLRLFLLLAITLVAMCPVRAATPNAEELEKSLPTTLGKFRRANAPEIEVPNPDTSEFTAKAYYIGSDGTQFTVALYHVQQDSRAYELLTTTAATLRQNAQVDIGSTIGTAGFAAHNVVAFFKGPNFVKVEGGNARADERERLALLALSQELAQRLDRGEGEVPVLLKHLPNWEQAEKTAVYLTRFSSIEPIATDPVLNVISSEGDADAVLANYDQARLLVIEFNTPQRAAENDQRIMARIHELWNLGQSAPAAYRRIGNYVAFVFDAPNEQAAKQLIDQVHYEQVVSWLGRNPNILKEAERRYVETTLGVLVAVLKASGFALIGCFATGALFGALLFTRRRARQRSVEAFSDAGGMLRLNLDQITPQTNPARLLPPH